MRDASSKGRVRNLNDWRGQKNPKSKLKESDYEEIKNKHLSGLSRFDLSKLYRVSSVRISQILKSFGIKSELNHVDAAAKKRKAQTHCKRGHEFNKENTRLNKDGGRICKTCQTIYQKNRNK